MNDKGEITKFIISAVLLLYLCCLVVLNVSSLSLEGTWYGFLPFKAFTPKYIVVTILLFAILLLVCFTNVVSYLKDKDKEFKFYLFNNKTDGYSKWAKNSDIKSDKGIVKVNSKSTNIKAAGIPLIINRVGNMWVDNGEYHSLVIGASGSGKTECVVKPLVNLLAKHGESMVITDPKGELHAYCAEQLQKMGYKIVVLDFRDPEKGNSWNPLSMPYRYYKAGDTDKAIELLDDVSLNILYEKNANADPFWERSAADYFSGLALGLFQDAPEEEVNINSIFYMSTLGEQKIGPVTYAKEYFTMKGEDSAAYISAANTITAPNDTKGSILSTFSQKLKIFSTKETLSEMLSYSDFDMASIGDEKTAVFMIIHDEKKTYHSLMTIFIKQCYETLIDQAQKSGGKLKYRTNFILDEFANMPALKDVDAMVTAARSRKIRFTFIIQNYAQLNDVYGEEVAATIRGNCGNLIYLISTELKALEEISKMCGEVKSKESEKTSSTPLVTVSDLQKLKLFEAIILRIRLNPFRTKLTPNFKLDWGLSGGTATIPDREKRQVHLFDLKEFVSNKKKEASLNSDGASDGGMGGFNPFIGSSPFGGGNPFGPSPFDTPAPNPFLSKPQSFEETNNPFASKKDDSNPYASLSSKDIDDIIRDMEKKINAGKSFDDEDEEDSRVITPTSKTVSDAFDFDKDDEEENSNLFIKPIKEKPLVEADDDIKAVENAINKPDDIESLDSIEGTQEIRPEDLKKPVVNVDKDSVVVNDKVVTDDEYLDDFFDN